MLTSYHFVRNLEIITIKRASYSFTGLHLSFTHNLTLKFQELNVSLLTARAAARLVGVSTPTITNKCKKGIISATHKPVGKNRKEWQIEKSELLRVYPEVKQGADKPIKLTKDMASNADAVENKFLKEKIEELEKQIEKTEAREEAANKRLDSVLLQLEDQRPKGFWSRLTGK